MAHKNKLDPNFMKKLRKHYEVTPQDEFVPSLRGELMERFSSQERKAPSLGRRRVVMALVATFAAVVIVFFRMPIYEVLGQIFVELFPKAESNILPNYPGQTAIAKTAIAVLNATTTPTAADSNSTATDNLVEPTRKPQPLPRETALLTIEEVEDLAGFDVLVPDLLPHARPWYGAPVDAKTNRVMAGRDWQTVLVQADSPWAMEFQSAGYDPETKIVSLIYLRFNIQQEKITSQDDCDLCTEVGASAKITEVQIGDVPGEIVHGVWNLLGETKAWENNPWVQRLRWESNNTVFQINYFYFPGSLTYDSMVEMAESFE